MITLSFSTINSVILCPHSWLAKVMGLPQVESEAAKEGKAVHSIVSDYTSGRVENPLLEKLGLPRFPVVEEKDFDDRLKVAGDFNGKYRLHGFVDGRTEDWSSILEIKSSGIVWTPGKFAKSPQWKMYGLMNPAIKQVTLVATLRDVTKWDETNIKVYKTEITEKNIQEARGFVEKGIQIIEHIHEQKHHEDQPNRFCWTKNCPFCGGNQE